MVRRLAFRVAAQELSSGFVFPLISSFLLILSVQGLRHPLVSRKIPASASAFRDGYIGFS